VQYISGTTDFKFQNTLVSLGKFDGMHKGHRKLIERLKSEKQSDQLTVVFTFDVPPKKIISGSSTKCILTKTEKKYVHESLNIDVLIEYPFNSETASMSPEEFVKEILVDKLGVKKIVVGNDFKFGKNRSGDISVLIDLGRVYGFSVIALEKEKYGLKDISSTIIKKEIENGNIKKANEMLGYPFMVIGEVVYGARIGNTIGFPTINIIPSPEKILPIDGVYHTKVSFDNKEYKGITNVGYKPTVTNEKIRGIETFIFDFSGDLYGKNVIVQFEKFIREEKKFSSLEALKNQIKKDIEKII